MLSKNNQSERQLRAAQHLPHYGFRKLHVGGVATVLLGIGLAAGFNSPLVAHADVNSASTSNGVAAVSSDQSTPANASQQVLSSGQSTAQAQLAQGSTAANGQQQAVDKPTINLVEEPTEVPDSELGSVEIHNYSGTSTAFSPIKYTRDSTTGKLKTIDLTSVAQQAAQDYSTNVGTALADVQVEFLDNNNHVIGSTVDPNTLADPRQNMVIYVYAHATADAGTEAKKTQKQMDEQPLTPTKSGQYTFKNSSDSGDITNISYLTPAEGMKVAGSESTYENSINKNLPTAYWEQLKNLGTITYKDDSGNTVTKYLAANPNPDGNYSMYNQWLPDGSEASTTKALIDLLSGGHKDYSFASEDDFDNSTLGQLVMGNNGFALYDSQSDLDSAYNDFLTNYPSSYESSFKRDTNTSAIVYLPEYDDSGNVIPDKYAGAVFLYKGDDTAEGAETINAVYRPLDKTYTGKLAPVYLYTAGGSSNGVGPFLKITVQHDESTQTVKRTIHYVYANGNTAAPDHSDELTFNAIDGNWSANQDFTDVSSPAITGYTPDQSVVSNKNISHDHADIVETVTYRADQQTLTYTVIDDTTGTTLAGPTVLATGDSNSTVPASAETTYDQVRQSWLSKGYKLDNAKDNGQGYDSLPTDFDNDTSADQNATIYLVHTYSPVNPENPHDGVNPDQYEKTVTETVHYVGAGDKTPADHVQTSKWVRTLTIDNVTGQLVPNGQYDTDWSIAQGDKSTYDRVDTPHIDGFAADQAYIPSFKVTMDNQTYLVVYQSDASSTPDQPQQPKSGQSQPISITHQPNSGQSQPISITHQLISSQTPQTLVKASTNETGEHQLPQTGSNADSATAAAGLAGLVLSTMLGLGLSKKRQD